MNTYQLFRVIFGIIVVITAIILTTRAIYDKSINLEKDYNTINIKKGNKTFFIVLMLIILYLLGISSILEALSY